MIIQEYKEKNGVKIFHHDTNKNHADYNSQGLDNIYKVEEEHFWFISRKDFILQQMIKDIDFTSKIIEIGAGTGNVSQYLKLNGYTNISVGEMHAKGLVYANSYGLKDCYQFDLLRSPFEDEFEVVCAFDVLEHIEKDEVALENIYKMLTKSGKIILTIPAHQWLWNRADSIAGHKRRYTRRQIISKLEDAGFSIISTSYFFISIIPLLLLRSLLNKDSFDAISPEEYKSNISINPILNKILLYITKFENKINKLLPNFIGGSLFVIAIKQ
ncbi:MAG: class I SAM-dependent methyltransferase [gamma proteobacterium symbiont of Taylorina sp.]|nr:class I SAM-dependent methyltransferase [gamma proteobacterium symbiont of Taylorina sp.]